MDVDVHLLCDLARDLGFVAVYLHGSRTTGTARPDSDVDLAVLVPSDWPPERFEEAAEHLAGRLAVQMRCGRDIVDIQDLRAAPPHFRARVITTGRLLFVADSTALARFQARSLPEAWDEAIFMRPIREAMRRRIAEGRFAS